jgi:hypothetical protein
MSQSAQYRSCTGGLSLASPLGVGVGAGVPLLTGDDACIRM